MSDDEAPAPEENIEEEPEFDEPELEFEPDIGEEEGEVSDDEKEERHVLAKARRKSKLEKVKKPVMRPAVISQYELSAILQIRAEDISNGAKVLIKIDPRKALRAMDIAKEEYRQKKLPMDIVINRIDGQKDYIPLYDKKTIQPK